ncbi:MAG TPA: Rho termination factor N-terminal domain-containing protein, partial [Chitinophagaceae bacterium]
MYDILQLNDMLVPELLDIAEKLDIVNPKKLDKQELIYKILDKQAVLSAGDKAEAGDNGLEKKGRRRKLVKKEEQTVVEEPVPAEEKENKIFGRKNKRPVKSSVP